MTKKKTESYKEQIEEINRRNTAIIRKLEESLQPLAQVATWVIDGRGGSKGFLFRKRREYKHKDLMISKEGGIFGRYIRVHYQGELVFRFDESLFWRNERTKERLLFIYKPGDWQEKLIEEYREMRLGKLEANYHIHPEFCVWYDHDKGSCSVDSIQACPCPDYADSDNFSPNQKRA